MLNVFNLSSSLERQGKGWGEGRGGEKEGKKGEGREKAELSSRNLL